MSTSTSRRGHESGSCRLGSVASSTLTRSAHTRTGGLLGKRKGPRDPLWARVLVLFGALMMMVSGGVIIGSKILVGRATGAVDKVDMLGAAAARGESINGPLNVLMVGLDERPDSDEAVRADSIIILHVNAAHDQAYLVSIPRDLLVTIPAVKNLHPVKEEGKINGAFAFGAEKGGREGGFQVLAETVNKLTGINFNAGAMINFGGFQEVVNELGGVHMCIDQAVDSYHIGIDKSGNLVPRYKYPNAKPVHYSVGCRDLKGWEALDYVRQRYGLPHTDYDRARHQQQFLKALVKKAKSKGMASNPVKALDIARAAGKALTLTPANIKIENWIYTLSGVMDNELIMLKTNSGNFNPVKDPLGNAAEQLNKESIEMFDALRTDKLAEFVMRNPGFVATDSVA